MPLDELVPTGLFSLIGVMLIAAGVPLVRGTVPPGAYGLRTGETLANPEVWYAANRYAGRDLIVLGSLLVLYAILGLWWRPVRDPDEYLMVTIVACFFAGVVVGIRGWLFGIRHAQRTRNTSAS